MKIQVVVMSVLLAAMQPVWAETVVPSAPSATVETTETVVEPKTKTVPYRAAANIDPYESYNRTMFQINEVADNYVLLPVAKAYRTVTPNVVRQGVRNFFDNLRDVVSFGSNILRLDIKRASEDFIRVAINTTFGLGGLINIADAGGIPNNKNTLGDTLATWGWKNSHYLVLPLLGPSTVRDGTASLVHLAYPAKNLVFETDAGRWAATGVDAINTRENLLDLTDGLEEAALDKYAYTRDLYMAMRQGQIEGKVANSSANAEEDVDIDELVAPEDNIGQDKESNQESSTSTHADGNAVASEGVTHTDATSHGEASGAVSVPCVAEASGVAVCE